MTKKQDGQRLVRVERAPKGGRKGMRKAPPDAALALDTEAALAVAQAELVALDKAAEEAVDASVPVNTRRAYEYELSCFASWCARRQVAPMPASPRVLRAYLFELAEKGRSKDDMGEGTPKGPFRYSSLIRTLAAICKSHHKSGHASPWKNPFIEETRVMLARRKGEAQTKKRDIGASGDGLLMQVCDLMGDDLRGIRDRAMILVGWQGGGRRRSEIVAATIEHFVPIVGGIRWTIPRSKTDQTGIGIHVALTKEDDERYCAISALQKWIEMAKIDSGPVFRGIKGETIFPHALAPEAVSRRVQFYVKKLGLDPSEFGGHSIRSGFITTAHRMGRTEADIMEATGHKTVRVLRGYIRRANEAEESAGRGLIGDAMRANK